MPRGWSRAMEEEGSSKLVSPFLRGKRESKLNKESNCEKESEEAQTIESRKKEEEVKTEENGEAEVKKDSEEAKVDPKVEDEKKDEAKVNGHENENGKNGEGDHVVPDVKGKGKGKGKGKSSSVKSPISSEAVEEVKAPKESPKPKVGWVPFRVSTRFLNLPMCYHYRVLLYLASKYAFDNRFIL